MPVNVTTTRLYRILDVTPPTHNVMLVGRHGIGKSQILTRYYSERGLRVVPLFLGQMADPGDLLGLPLLRAEETSEGQSKDVVNGLACGASASTPGVAQASGISGSRYVTDFAPPRWFPTDGQPVVLFLDELNRARPELLQTVMDLVLNRRLGGHQLPEGSRIISAVNEGDEYQLTLLDPALVSRFNVYHFCPTVAEWLLWAERSGIDSRVTRFIAAQATWLDGNESDRPGIDSGLEKQPDRRAWQRVSDVIRQMPKLEEDDLDVIAGIVGAPAASQFYASVTGRRTLSGSEVLAEFPAHAAELCTYALHQLAQVNESIFRCLQVVGTGGTERTAPSGQPMTDGLVEAQTERYAKNLAAYYDMLVEAGEKEAIAHLCNLFESGTYEHAVLFIMRHTPDLYAKMALFIAGL